MDKDLEKVNIEESMKQMEDEIKQLDDEISKTTDDKNKIGAWLINPFFKALLLTLIILCIYNFITFN